jgi:hypothetical protein
LPGKMGACRTTSRGSLHRRLFRAPFRFLEDRFGVKSQHRSKVLV